MRQPSPRRCTVSAKLLPAIAPGVIGDAISAPACLTHCLQQHPQAGALHRLEALLCEALQTGVGASAGACCLLTAEVENAAEAVAAAGNNIGLRLAARPGILQ